MSKKLLIFLLGALLCVQSDQIKASQPNPLVLLGFYGDWTSHVTMAASWTLGFYIGNYVGKKFFESNVIVASKDLSGLQDNQSKLKNIVGTLPKELDSFLDILKNPEHYKKIGVNVPKSILFNGPPGTGKTEYARAIANTLKAQYFEAPGAEFKSQWIGRTSENIRNFFADVRMHVDQLIKEKKPSKDQYLAVIFIDELDGIGLAPREDSRNIQDERTTVTSLLTELTKQNKHILIIAASNHKDKLDPALKRPGRFDLHIEISLPDIQTRFGILKHYANKYKTAAWQNVSKALWRSNDDAYEKDMNTYFNSNGLIMRMKAKKEAREEVDLKSLSEKTDKFSGADLKELCNKAAMFAAKGRKPFVSQKEFDEAFAIMNKEKAEMDKEKDDKPMSAEVRNAMFA